MAAGNILVPLVDRIASGRRALRLLPFSPRTSQRNRIELGETTVNKTWRKHFAAIKISNLADIHCVRSRGSPVLRSTGQIAAAQPAAPDRPALRRIADHLQQR